jgi:hypothetical protein
MSRLSLRKLVRFERAPSPRRRTRQRFRPLAEALETRLVPATLHVGSGAGEYPTIGAAVAAAQSGDTIDVDPGTYNELVTVNVPNLTINGAQAGVDARTRSVPRS